MTASRARSARLVSTLAYLTCLGVAVGACGRAHLFYDTRELRHAPIQKGQEAALTQTVVDKLGGRSVTWVDAAGRQRVVAASAVGSLPLPERGALWLTLSTGDVGGESDVRVRIGKGSVPVTVTIALDGAVRVVSGARDGGVRGKGAGAPTLAAIKERFGLRGQVPGKWSDAERQALNEALEALGNAELAAVRDLHFARRPALPHDDPSRAALYEMRGCRGSISVYASGVRADAFRFVGDAGAPRNAVLHSMLHEIGHAFEQHAARAKYCAADELGRRDVARRNALVEQGNKLTARSPVLVEYQGVLDGDPAPTDYGNTSPHESFAESFALFFVDPAALQRARPRVFAWFAKGGHVAAARAASRA